MIAQRLTQLLACLLLLLPLHARATSDRLLSEGLAGHGAIMLFIVPDTGAIVDANHAAANFYGYSLEQLRRMSIQEINAIGPAEVAAERQRAREENRNYFIFPHRLASGEIRTVEVYSSPTRLDSGRTVLFSIIHDITGKHVAESELLDYKDRLEELVATRTGESIAARAWIERLLIGGLAVTLILNMLLIVNIRRKRAALAAREQARAALALSRAELQRFAEVSAHHLQEPARRLASYAERLQKQLPAELPDEEARISLGFIGEQAQRLKSLIRDVQRYLAADQERGPLPDQGCDTAAVAREVVAAHAAQLTTIGASIEIAPGLPRTMLDAPRLHDILDALVDNALRHRGKQAAPHITISGSSTASHVLLQVADNGPGIAPEFRQRVLGVFEHLGRTPGSEGRAGNGLGLALVRRIAESIGGRIWIADTPGGGCTVNCELPRKPTP